MIVKEFAGADHVVFGDINLQEASIRDPKYGAGAGGWPTIRYFNQATGYDGKPYTKKTSKSMCDELGGDGEYLRAYVNEMGVAPCEIASSKHCSEKETRYITVMQGLDTMALQKEAVRLGTMLSGSIKPDLKQWIQQRAAILAQLLAQRSADEL